MRPIDLYTHPSIRKTFQLGIEKGYPAGNYELTSRLGGLVVAKEVRAELPGKEGEYYDFWWFPKHYGMGYDRAKTPSGQITRRYLGGSVSDHARAMPTQSKHVEILRMAGTDTRLDQPYELEDGIWKYRYQLLVPPIGGMGIALALETVTMQGELTFAHVFGLFPSLSGKVPVNNSPAVGVLA